MKKLLLAICALASTVAFAADEVQFIRCDPAAGETSQDSTVRPLKGGAEAELLTTNGIKNTGTVAGMTEEVAGIITTDGEYLLCVKDDGQDGIVITKAQRMLQ